MSFNETLQKIVNMEYDELVYFAKSSVEKVLPACKVVDSDHDGMLMLTSILLSAVGADGEISAKENQFIQDVAGIDEDAVNALIKIYNNGMADLVDNFADTLGGEVKTNVIILVASICSCDEVITVEENTFLHKLLAE